MAACSFSPARLSDKNVTRMREDLLNSHLCNFLRSVETAQSDVPELQKALPEHHHTLGVLGAHGFL